MAWNPTDAERERCRNRNRRKRLVAGRSEQKRAMRRHLRLVPPPPKYPRPTTRAECQDGPRPCPYVGCRHHLYLDVLRSGSLKLNFPDLQPHQLEETCSLDLAERGGAILEDVGAALNVTRERIRQIEKRVLDRLQRRALHDPQLRKLLAMWGAG